MIPQLNRQHDAHIQHTIDMKTKPQGALGKLETLAHQLVTILSQGMERSQLESERPDIVRPQMLIFAGDHGIAGEGVSIAPSEVTAQMVANFATGGAAINVLCAQLGWQLSVIDCGILTPPAPELNVVSQRLGNITRPLHLEPALNEAQLEQGLALGQEAVKPALVSGTNLFALGEMGIGNTTAAAAIFSALSGLTSAETVGRGTGVSDEVVAKKQQLIEQALRLHREALHEPREVLRRLGGFEICQMVGAMLEIARAQKIVLVDGFIATVAAMLAYRIAPACKDYMVFAHCSGEQGHQAMLNWLNVEPLLNLNMRLGEGTGAALALPLCQSALAFYYQMASFEAAAVTQVVETS
ncbi:nicotinate-nucleotide--dimethylbenzimidazole phosphoribosyltransferase [Pseudoalteromonas sp. R3]|uniref:nicotinate-nucleotide--dimethylbenzimidazole phosphoribosyltransferase n=1 Tax=Pseudoalteromonas sp. R3 TaxID=1709477 RepID=UPI0006B49183|nr:nicotinate-nucleotide--dimethylbenzimidazole phosphoribosyltransferase [Pseudoalteromonas sp. R3]AZZ97226.1 nicotinate-nucleotide--dimethylbenzimidazole phosphoribosyltransferase [Pseudoalteromonas sp. R3]